jgi:ubiquinone biosynthesis monooxygenase Coq7
MSVAVIAKADKRARREQRTIARILKVNHAGEYGAIRIYGAQLMMARALYPDLVPFLTGTLEHEQSHCRRFRDAMTTRQARPCYAMWCWGIGGSLLGFATAAMGRNAIMACTKAVEQTVHVHLDEQIRFLAGRDGELQALIADIQVEEDAHLDHARRHIRATPLTRAIEAFVNVATGIVIWLSTQGAVTRMVRDLRETD